MGAVLSVVLAVGVPIGIGAGIGLLIKDDIKTWYKTLKKPTWSPPNWLFGPVWTVLYGAMGYTSWLVWKNGAGALPLCLYALQAVLNYAWSPIFVRAHDITFALADISALLGVLGATIVTFRKISPTAAYILVPYFGWVSFATALTAALWKLNPQERDGKITRQLQELVRRSQKKARDDIQTAKQALKKAEDSSAKLAKAASSEAQKVGQAASEAGKKVAETAGKVASAVKEEAHAAAEKVAASLQAGTPAPATKGPA